MAGGFKKLKGLPILAIGIGAFLLVYWLYTKLFAVSPAQRVANQETLKASKVASDTMANGYTYYAFSQEIFNMLYASFFWGFVYSFSLKDTDEEALGRMLQTVTKEEFPKLCEVYVLYKRANAISDENSLVEDLYNTFNAKERAMYMAHLID